MMRMVSHWIKQIAITASIMVTGCALAYVTARGVPLQGPSTEAITVTKAVAPIYPALARLSNTQGTVEVTIEVGPTGEVVNVADTKGHSLLRDAAQTAARRWRFVSSTTDDTKPLRTVVLTFKFTIMPLKTDANELTPVFTPPYEVEVRQLTYEPVVHSDPRTYVRSPRRRSAKKEPKRAVGGTSLH